MAEVSFQFYERSIFSYLGENPLRCITQDEKGLVLTTMPFYYIF
jgi:hypothetical protein